MKFKFKAKNDFFKEILNIKYQSGGYWIFNMEYQYGGYSKFKLRYEIFEKCEYRISNCLIFDIQHPNKSGGYLIFKCENLPE